jgi:hypothetical protein
VTTTRYRETSCPVCETKLDACTGVNHDDTPREGDVTLCIGCGSFLVFGPELQLRPMTDAEVGDLDDETRITLQRARRSILELLKRRETHA